MKGQILRQAGVPPGPKQQIDLSDLSAGSYFLQILDGQKQYNAKFVKQ
jgi:hypothetical protein